MDSTLTTTTTTTFAALRRRPFSFTSRRRRSGYVRLNNTNPTPIQLGDPSSRSFWRIKKLRLRLRLRLRPRWRRRRLDIRVLRGWRWWRKFSPKKWLRKLRDAYVNMMIGFAGAAGGGGCTVEYGGFGRPALKEYDEKVIVEIYKSLVLAQGQIAAAAAAGGGKVGSQPLVCRAAGL